MDPHTVGILLGVLFGAIIGSAGVALRWARTTARTPVEPAPIGITCYHTWDQWTPIQQGKVRYQGRFVGRYVELSRTCTTCGDVEMKEVRTDA